MKKTMTFAVLIFVFALQALSLDSASLGIFGDGGVIDPAMKVMRDSMRAQKVSRLILLGDNLYDEKLDYSQIWNPWIQGGFQFLGVAIGNHSKSYREESAFFKTPGEFYSFSYQGARFVILNSDNEKTGPAQAQFLEQTLLTAKEAQIYLILHHPFVTVSERHNWEERSGFQIPFRNLVKKYSSRISAVFSGHDHLASIFDVDGVPLLIAGAAYENFPAININRNDGKFNIRSRWNYKGGFYWIRFTMLNGHTWAEYVRTDKPEISCSVRLFPKPFQLGSNCR